MQKDKKKWNKPKLIILVRGEPEEMTLAYCRGLDVAKVGGVSAGAGGCIQWGPLCIDICSLVTAS
jgi:hypothetical protein